MGKAIVDTEMRERVIIMRCVHGSWLSDVPPFSEGQKGRSQNCGARGLSLEISSPPLCSISASPYPALLFFIWLPSSMGV